MTGFLTRKQYPLFFHFGYFILKLAIQLIVFYGLIFPDVISTSSGSNICGLIEKYFQNERHSIISIFPCRHPHFSIADAHILKLCKPQKIFVSFFLEHTICTSSLKNIFDGYFFKTLFFFDYSPLIHAYSFGGLKIFFRWFKVIHPALILGTRNWVKVLFW